MTAFADLVEKAQARVAANRLGATDGTVQKRALRSGGGVLKSGTVDGYGSVPSVPDAGNRTQPRDEGGRFLSSATSEPAESQPFNPSRDGWQGNVDTEASRTHAPGSIVQGALDRGRQNVQQYPQHTISGAIAEAAARHQIQVLGHQAGVQPSVEGAYQSKLVDASSSDDRTWRSYQAALQRLVNAFRESTGRFPTFGAPGTPEDQQFLIAASRLRNQFWPDGSSDPDADREQLNVQ